MAPNDLFVHLGERQAARGGELRVFSPDLITDHTSRHSPGEILAVGITSMLLFGAHG